LQELPLKAWFPIDIQQPGNYLLIFGFQLIIVAVGPMINIGTDTFITGLIIHACGEFRILKKSLRSLKQRALQLQHEDTGFRSQKSLELFMMGKMRQPPSVEDKKCLPFCMHFSFVVEVNDWVRGARKLRNLFSEKFIQKLHINGSSEAHFDYVGSLGVDLLQPSETRHLIGLLGRLVPKGIISSIYELGSYKLTGKFVEYLNIFRTFILDFHLNE
jgi:hypothetical protein